jgi:hypothetical protein
MAMSSLIVMAAGLSGCALFIVALVAVVWALVSNRRTPGS